MVKVFKSRHTTSHLFKIDNFSLLQKHGIRCVRSSVFDLGGYKWQLSVYPRGYLLTNYVSIFLENRSPIHLMLEYEVYVVSQIEQKWHSRGKFPFGKDPCNKGNQILMNFDDLEKEGYLIGDCCMFGVKLFGIKPAKFATAECFTLIEKPQNYKTTWKITNFSSLDPEIPHRSNEFVVANRKWQIEIHPRGYSEDKYKSFSVFLCEVGSINNVSNVEVVAKFKLRVLDQVNRDHIEEGGWANFGETDQGFPNFMPLKKLKEPYLVKDKLYVGVEFEVVSVTNPC